MTEEEKYRRKAEMLKRALASADEMDQKDAGKAASNLIKAKSVKRFVIETSDRELIHELWAIKTDDIEIEEPLRKSIGPVEISICIYATSDLIKSITKLIDVILSHSERKPGKTKTKTYVKKSEKEISKIFDSHKGVIDVEAVDEDGE